MDLSSLDVFLLSRLPAQSCASEQIRDQTTVIGLCDCYVEYVHQFLLHFLLLEGKHRPEKSINTHLCDGRYQLQKGHKLMEKKVSKHIHLVVGE